MRNLSRKKREAWLHLRNISNIDDQQLPNTMAEYRRLRSLTKVAADKARNAWWSAKAVEAEKKANTLQQLGCGGSVVKELRLLKKQASKPSSSNIPAKNRSILSSDIDKLQRWAEHFAEVSNCCSSRCQWDTDALPNIIAATPSYRQLFPDDENLSQPISEDEI